MGTRLLSRILALCGIGRGGRPKAAPEVVVEEPPDFVIPAPGPADSIVGRCYKGRCYRGGGELFTVLKDGTSVLLRGSKTPVPWYEPRDVVLQNLARYGLEKPACSGSGFWYDAGRVPLEEHLAVQDKKPPGSVKQWVDA